MSLALLLSQTATVVHVESGTVDRYGDATSVETSRVHYAARVEQAASTETTEGRDTIVSDWRLYLPPDAVIGASDRVECSGNVFEVVGAPDAVRSPRGVHHIEARLRYVSD